MVYYLHNFFISIIGFYFPMIATNMYKKESDTTSNIVTIKQKNSKKEDYIMLQLQTKATDICRISKLLVKYNIKASITNSVITLEGDIPDELLIQLLDSINIKAVQNFISQEPLYVPKETSFIKSEEPIPNEVVEKTNQAETTVVEEATNAETIVMEETKNVETTTSTLSHNTFEYDLIYSEVKRGEVYLCDLGEPYGSEQGLMRYTIVIQNDDGNLHSPTTIVIACTAEPKKRLPVHFHCTFSSRNMIDYDLERVGSAENVIMAEQIHTVDKSRLRKYLGTLTPEFMEIIEGKIDISLDLSKKEKKAYVDIPAPQKAIANMNTAKERKDVNMVQVKLLSFVDINELFKISQSYFSNDVKAQKILELFGFDLKKNGVQYLLKAIIAYPKDVYFNLETLSESISSSEDINKEEVKRLIVARVKETFGFRKAPTIDFIRLVNNFLEKQEEV